MKIVLKFMLALQLIIVCISCVSRPKQTLAEQIKGNHSFQTVDSMGRQLLAQGFNAGTSYSQVWIRDLNTFVETACEEVDTKNIREAILFFFRLQQENNEIIDGYVLKEEFNWEDTTRYYSAEAPDHVGFKNTVETDQETSLIQTVGKYIQKTGDRSILEEVIGGKSVYTRMKLMIDYLLTEKQDEKYGLLTGALTADWGDVQALSDNVVDMDEHTILTIDVYDNAMFVIAMDDILQMSDNDTDKQRWQELRDRFATNTRKYLWDEQNHKFIPHIYLDKRPDLGDFDESLVHYHGGTTIAIEAGLLTKEEIAIVNAQMLENVRLSGMKTIGLTIYPVYPDDFFHGGMSRGYIYQNGGDWTWFGGRMIQQLIKNGYMQEAYDEVAPMIERVIKNNGFYEWYGQGEIPNGSGNFKGSAGVLCKTISLFRNWAEQNTPKQPVDWVDTQLGATHCRWFFYTPAALPFGMAKLAPTTNAYNSPGSWTPNGYDDRHSSIEGFAHLHEFQIGGIVTMPTVGALKTLPGTLEEPDKGYRSRFRKSTEQAMPGYYCVMLEDYDIKAELTATERVGYHRYTYPQSDSSRILFDIGHPQGESAEVVDTHISYQPAEHAVSGFVECYPVYATFSDKGNTVKSYFYARLPKHISKLGTYRDSIIYPDSTEIAGIGTGMYLEFQTSQNEIIEMQVGLSYTSVANAKMNIEKESAGKDFDSVKEEARNIWNKQLSRIEVEGGTADDKTKFYTGLYHVLLGRGIASDADGSYITHSKQIAKINCDKDGVPLYNHHNTDGMWGGFWNLTQLWTLAYPEVFNSYVRSTLDFSHHTNGWLHDGEAAGVYTNGVQTNFQGLITVAAYNAGIIKDDLEYLWKVVYQNEMGYENRPDGAGRYDNNEFVKKGYVPLHSYTLPNGWICNFGASHTLEYCFAAYAASQLAESLGKQEQAEQLKKYAKGYHLLFDRSIGYIRPRETSGEFMKDFEPMKAWIGFQEGNGAQYTWYVPHDIGGLIRLLGKDEFNKRLENTFQTSSKMLYGGTPEEFDSFSGVEQLYNHGNQPCLHNAWLFNYSGKPWLTQQYTRDICNVFYGTEPTHGYGYGQDEDQGQLGAWYALAAIGLFDVQGGTNKEPTMQIGSPLFDKITIHLNKKYYSGDTFVIQTEGNSENACYVQEAQLNGKEMNKCFISLRDIQNGGILQLKMGTTPNQEWGTEVCPPSMSDLEDK